MAKKSTVKIPGKKSSKGAITIPGTKIKAPRELVILAGGGILAALFFMRGSEEEREVGIPSGISAMEIAEILAREREAMTGAIEDINQQLEDLREQEPEQETATSSTTVPPPTAPPPTTPPPPPESPFMDLTDVETESDLLWMIEDYLPRTPRPSTSRGMKTIPTTQTFQGPRSGRPKPTTRPTRIFQAPRSGRPKPAPSRPTLSTMRPRSGRPKPTLWQPFQKQTRPMTQFVVSEPKITKTLWSPRGPQR